MKEKQNKKAIIAIIVVAIVIAITGGSTYAYWYWVTNTTQQTNVSATVKDGISMTIYPSTTVLDQLYPITRTNCNNSKIEGTALVVVKNYTDVLARPQFYLKLQITNKSGTNITATTTTVNDENGKKLSYAEYINFAVVDTANTNTGTTCANAKRAGKFTSTQTKAEFGTGTAVSGWYNSPMITVLSGTGTDESDSTRYPILSTNDSVLGTKDESSMTFDVPAAATCYESNETTTATTYKTRQDCVKAGKKWLTRVEHTFKFWAWLDSSYKFTNTGDAVTDPMQDAKITISWSESSGIKQITGA